jgi:hypothetical protein
MMASAVAIAQQPGKQAPAAASSQPKSQFLRLTRDAKNHPVALETSIVRFAPADHRKDGPAVDLIGALHIGEKSYYKQLNREFANYDVVLYELIAKKEAVIPKGSKGTGSALSGIQNGMKDMLNLEFQLQQIDYTAKNLVHADMSPEQFSESMRNDDFVGMFARMMGYAMAKQQQSDTGATNVQLFAALFSKNRALALKRIMAEQFESSEGQLTAMEGPQGSTLIARRNKVALDELRKQLAAGKRKIAIFYGAGHMSDMQKRLHDDFGLVPTSTRWLTAWDLTGGQK